MVYLIGTRNREYIVEGVLIPKKEYNEREVEMGKRTVVEIDETCYSRLCTNPIFKQLVKLGDVLVRDKKPEGQETLPELRERLAKQQDDTASRIAALMDEIASLKANAGKGVSQEDYDLLKEEAKREIRARDKYIDDLEAILKEYEIEFRAEDRPK